jgi:creatinine amidohydrolase/Fe(II)-dependent formamide hydrolase-like protein
MIRLAERTYEEAARLARDPKTVIMFPLGAIEEHGPHLPLLVDWLGAEELARVVAPYLRRAGWRPVLVPSMPYGASPLAENWIGTVSLSTGTLRRVVVEIIRGLSRHGFRRFVLTNYQADPGHLRAMALIKRSAERRDRMHVLFAGFAPGHSNAAMVNPPRHGAPPEPAAGSRVALGRARDGHGARCPPRFRSPRPRSAAAARLGRCEARAGGGSHHIPKDEPEGPGILRLAGGGPRRDRPRRPQAPRPVDLAGSDLGTPELAPGAESQLPGSWLNVSGL